MSDGDTKDPKPAKKRGRPKGPCNPRELAQRRTAAWKHGGRAATALRQSVHPCRESSCPLADDDSEGYPCTMRRGLEDQGAAMEVCLPRLAIDPKVRDAYLDALRGDERGLQPLIADVMAAQAQLHVQELGKLLAKGFELPVHAVTKDGAILTDEDGEPVVIKTVVNPAAIPTLKLAELMGYTAQAQAIGPAYDAKQRRDNGFAKLAALLAQNRSEETRP